MHIGMPRMALNSADERRRFAASKRRLLMEIRSDSGVEAPFFIFFTELIQRADQRQRNR